MEWRLRTFVAVLTALLLPPAVGVSWSSIDFNGQLQICLLSSYCGSYYTDVTLISLIESNTDTIGSYAFDFGPSDPAYAFIATTSADCGDFGNCQTRAAEVVLPNGGTAYATPAANGDPVLKMNVTRVATGVVSTLAGGTGYVLPVALGVGDMIVTYEFDGWDLYLSNSTLNFTLGIDSVIGGVADDGVDISYDANADFKRFSFGNGIYFDFPYNCILEDGTNATVGISYSGGSNTELILAFPNSTLIQYSYAMWFVSSFDTSSSSSNDSSSSSSGSSDASTSSASSPSSVLNLFSGGFEYCAAANCSTDIGVLSLAVDRLGIGASFNSTALRYSNVTADFTQVDSLPFAPSFEYNNVEINPLILEINEASGGIKASKNSSILLYGPSDTSIITTSLAVAMLEDETSTSVMSETITVPAGALRVGIIGHTPTGSTLSKGYVSLSFLLFAMQDGNVVTNATISSSGMYSATVNISDMYLKFPTFGTVNGYETMVTPLAFGYSSGSNTGMIQLVIQMPAITTGFSYEFFIGSNNIQYSSTSSSTSSSSTASEIAMGDTKGPTNSTKDGKPVPTKLLALPHGQFGLCFDTSCSTSVVKLEFSGLASTEGERLNRFVDAAAFVFSEPQHTYSSTGAEIWSMSFTALVPQSRVRPPIPYDSLLASLYPTFSVRVDQYLAPGAANNSGQALSVPRGALKFSFNISNWQFASDSDTLVLNVTLSSVVGDVPGSTKFSTTSEDGLMRLSFDSDQYLDIPLLADSDGTSASISITPVFEADVGVVLMMVFSKFSSTLAYDPVLASDSLVAVDVSLARTPAKYTIVEAAGIALAAILGVMIAISVVRCVRKAPVKLDFSKIVL